MVSVSKVSESSMPKIILINAHEENESIHTVARINEIVFFILYSPFLNFKMCELAFLLKLLLYVRAECPYRILYFGRTVVVVIKTVNNDTVIGCIKITP